MLCYCALRDREKLKTGFKRLLTIDVPGEEDERYMFTDVSVTHTCVLVYTSLNIYSGTSL